MGGFPPFLILIALIDSGQSERDVWQAVTRTQADNFVNTKHVFTDDETQAVSVTRRRD